MSKEIQPRSRLDPRKKFELHVKQKIWLSHGFERFLWLKYNIYPSITGRLISNLENNSEYVRKSEPLAYFHHKSLKPNPEFLKDLEIVKNYLRDKTKVSSMLEFVIGLATWKVLQELPKDLPRGIIEIEKRFGAYIIDVFVETSYVTKVAFELKNVSGYVSLWYKEGELKRKLDFYINNQLKPMVIAPFLAYNLTNYLKGHGFFCNLGYNVVQYPGDSLIDSFYEYGLGETYIFYELDDWNTASEAKSWLRDALRNDAKSDLDKVSRKIFNDPRLDFLLRKVRGIFSYAMLLSWIPALQRNSKVLGKFSHLKIPQAHYERINLLADVFLIFLYRIERQTPLNILNRLNHSSRYLKKLNRQEKIKFMESTLKMLRDFGFLKSKGRSFFAEDVETPYPSKMQSELMTKDTQKKR